MSKPDLNLLAALAALLEEGSVSGAAARMHTSAPAMSRTLNRLRRTLDDPLLVRAGRRLVPTPRALELRGDVRALVRQADILLTPASEPDLAALTRSFTLQAGDMVLTSLMPSLLAAVADQAPGVTLRVLPENLEQTPAIRDGVVDIEIGAIDHADPETRVEQLTHVHPVGVVRHDHPLIHGRVTPRRFAAAQHIGVSRRGLLHGPIDERLAVHGLSRHIAITVPSYSAALFLVRDTDLVGLAPAGVGEPAAAALGLRTFPIPLDLPAITVGLAWHPRNDADAAHRWLRTTVRSVIIDLATAHDIERKDPSMNHTSPHKKIN